MFHAEYIEHLKKHFSSYSENSEFRKVLQEHKKEFSVVGNLNLDPAIPILNSLYSQVDRAPHRDPVCMLRALILMAVLKIASITKWVKETRTITLLAILAGFDPDDTPGIGTYYDFMKRIIDGPYQKSCEHRVRRSTLITGKYKRNIPKEKEAKKDSLDPHQSQSEKLIQELLSHADDPRPNDFQKILDNLLIKIGIVSSVEQGLLNLENLIVSGDGSILESNASSQGKPTCSCRLEGNYNCQHDRFYSSPTAQWCYDAHKDCFIFGDRYYHLVTSQNGHDFPLGTSMPGGNESDFTLSLKTVDRFFKGARENELKANIPYFCGDCHHDSYAHYEYFQKKGVVPVIPLSEKSQKVIPHLPDSNIQLDKDGTPLCPAGMKMHHHMYDKNKRVHVYSCPVKRNTHRDGKSVYITHTEECPRHQDCRPSSSLGPFVYIKSDTDPRLYPPLARNSQKFKEIMNQRTSTERCNYLNDTYHLDRACRNADYGLIRLTLVNIAEHALIRYLEAVKKLSEEKLFTQILGTICPSLQLRYLKAA
jgi:hypothetical protein